MCTSKLLCFLSCPQLPHHVKIQRDWWAMNPNRTLNGSKASVLVPGYEAEQTSSKQPRIFGRDVIKRDWGALCAHATAAERQEEELEALQRDQGDVQDEDERHLSYSRSVLLSDDNLVLCRSARLPEKDGCLKKTSISPLCSVSFTSCWIIWRISK